jgi:uncharacterized protein (DUF433 family)
MGEPDLRRITFDPQVMGGRASLRGLRVTVSMVVKLVAAGMGEAEILAAYPYLEPEDVRAALAWAALDAPPARGMTKKDAVTPASCGGPGWPREGVPSRPTRNPR